MNGLGSRAGDPTPLPEIPVRRRRWRGHLLRVLRNIALIYLGLCLSMSCLQDKLIFPGAASQGQKYALVLPSDGYDLVELRTAEGQKTYAVFVPAADASRRPLPDAADRATLIYFYGNGDHLANSISWANYFRTMGVNVLAVEYLGYGMAEGRPGEKQMYAVADAAYEHLLTRRDVNPSRIVPTGSSIGCAPAIDLAIRRPAAGLICFSPFTSMTAMGREVMPWMPTGWLLRYRFDNAGKIGQFGGPVFISHGRADDLVPFRMSEELGKLVRGPLTFVPLDGAGHNDVFDSAELFVRLREFVNAINAGDPSR